METTPTNTTNNVIMAAFNKWSDKVWFQILFVLIIIYLLAAPIATPLISNIFQQENTSLAMNKTLDDREQAKAEEHKLAFEKSKQAYAIMKKDMQESLTSIDCEYIFLIEYHNGAENIMTGIQFCKFDISLEVGDNVMDLVPQDKFRNENISKYDILLSDDLNKGKILYYTQKQFEEIDRYLSLQLKYLNAQSYTLITLKDNGNKAFGALLCISKNEHINTTEAMTLARKIELNMNTIKK